MARCSTSAGLFLPSFKPGQHHVVQHAELGEQVVELEDEADLLVADLRQARTGWKAACGFTIDAHLALVVRVHGAEDVEQGALAAAALAGDAHELTPRHLQATPPSAPSR